MNLDSHKILIVLHGSIGDVTRALPLANLIRRRYPNARLSWSIEPAAFPLVENHPAVDDVILLDRSRWWQSLGPFLKRIRSGRFDLVLDLQRLLKSGLISWWSGAPCRLGFHRYDAKEFNWLFNNHHIPPAGDGISKLSHYLKFAQWLGIDPYPVEWRLHLLPREEAQVEGMLRGVGSHFAVFLSAAVGRVKNGSPPKRRNARPRSRSAMGLTSFFWVEKKMLTLPGKSKGLDCSGLPIGWARPRFDRLSGFLPEPRSR